jgi:hypothetical protein
MNSSEILETVQNFLSRYIVLPPEQMQLVALWVLHTWQFSEQAVTPTVTPYLYIHSAQKGSGKTLVIDVLETLVRNPIRGTSMTPAVLFRLIEDLQPTILLDEIDTVWSGAKHDDLRGAINGGYRKGGHVWRVDMREPQKFSTFAPKLLAGIDNAMLPDTIRDRCIPILLQRATQEELTHVRDFYHYEIEDEVEAISNDLHVWAFDISDSIQRYRPEVEPTLSPRQWEISRELVSLANACGVESECRRTLVDLFTGVEQTETLEQTMLRLIRERFTNEERLRTTDILRHLILSDPRFGGLSGKGLAVKLAPFNVTPGPHRINGEVAKGFRKSDFEEAWERYL